MNLQAWSVRWALAASVALLPGCASSPAKTQWPVAPTELASSFSPLKKDTDQDKRMDAIAAALETLIAKANTEAQSSSERDWGSGDLVSAGGLMAVVGGLAERMGLVNTGAALGLIGGTGRARYQYPVQRQAYRKYESTLACVLTQLRLFNDQSRIMVLNAGDAAEKAIATKAPGLAIDAVNKARRKLLTDLDAVSTDAPSRQEIEALAAKYQQAASAPAPTPAPAASSAVSAARATLLRKGSIPDDSPFAVKPSNKDGRGGSTDKDDAWLVDDARNAGKAYPAEVERCTI